MLRKIPLSGALTFGYYLVKVISFTLGVLRFRFVNTPDVKGYYLNRLTKTAWHVPQVRNRTSEPMRLVEMVSCVVWSGSARPVRCLSGGAVRQRLYVMRDYRSRFKGATRLKALRA